MSVEYHQSVNAPDIWQQAPLDAWQEWEAVKNKLKYQWGRLTEEDFMCIENNQQDITEELAKTLTRLYGYTDSQARKGVHNFFHYRHYNIHAE